jgi:hypothetical protein
MKLYLRAQDRKVWEAAHNIQRRIFFTEDNDAIYEVQRILTNLLGGLTTIKVDGKLYSD